MNQQNKYTNLDEIKSQYKEFLEQNLNEESFIDGFIRYFDSELEICEANQDAPNFSIEIKGYYTKSGNPARFDFIVEDKK